MPKRIPHEQAFVRLKSLSGEDLANPELRPSLVADALEQETNLTEVALQILSERYKVPIEMNGRRTEPDPGDEVLNLRIPGRLAKAIKLAATRAGRKSWIAEIRYALQEYYELEEPEPVVRHRVA